MTQPCDLSPFLARIGYTGAKSGGVATLYPDDIGMLVALVEEHTRQTTKHLRASLEHVDLVLRDSIERNERLDQEVKRLRLIFGLERVS